MVTENWGWKYHHWGIPTSIKMHNGTPIVITEFKKKNPDS
jgi:hypothetical protein